MPNSEKTSCSIPTVFLRNSSRKRTWTDTRHFFGPQRKEVISCECWKPVRHPISLRKPESACPSAWYESSWLKSTAEFEFSSQLEYVFVMLDDDERDEVPQIQQFCNHYDLYRQNVSTFGYWCWDLVRSCILWLAQSMLAEAGIRGIRIASARDAENWNYALFLVYADAWDTGTRADESVQANWQWRQQITQLGNALTLMLHRPGSPAQAAPNLHYCSSD